MGDKMKKLWLTSLFFLLIISSFQAILYSQILGSIKGHVYDKETKVPLEKVIVTIISQKSEAIQYKLITDKKGYFYKSGLHIGIYMIKFEKKGYAPGATTIRIGIGSKEDLKISLPPFKGKKKGSNRIVEQSAKLINSGNFSEAITKLSEAIKDDPENYVLYYYRGYCFEKNKEYDRAIGDYQKSMKLNPEFLLAIQGSGNSYAKKKEFNNAIKFYQKAIELGNISNYLAS